MANGNLAACLKITLSHEGGWSDHPSDPGGATMKGVTIGRYRQYYPKATKTDLRNISDADLQKIYRDDYWKPVRGDDLPYGVDLAVFDFGVHSGPSRSSRYLQSVVGVKQDGVIGPQTLKATILADGKSVIQKLCGKRLSFVQGLSTFKVFGKGWSRRIADIEAKGVAMWLAKGSALSASARQELEAEGSKAKSTAASQNSGAGGVAAGGGGGAILTDMNGWIVAGVAVLVIAAAGYLILRARVNKERGEAYAAVAAE